MINIRKKCISDKTFEKISYIIDLQNSIHESKSKKQNDLIYRKALEDLKNEENTKRLHYF